MYTSERSSTKRMQPSVVATKQELSLSDCSYMASMISLMLATKPRSRDDAGSTPSSCCICTVAVPAFEGSGAA